MDFSLAQIISFVGNFVPERRMACNGQRLPCLICVEGACPVRR